MRSSLRMGAVPTRRRSGVVFGAHKAVYVCVLRDRLDRIASFGWTVLSRFHARRLSEALRARSDCFDASDAMMEVPWARLCVVVCVAVWQQVILTPVYGASGVTPPSFPGQVPRFQFVMPGRYSVELDVEWLAALQLVDASELASDRKPPSAESLISRPARFVRRPSVARARGGLTFDRTDLGAVITYMPIENHLHADRNHWAAALRRASTRVSDCGA